MSDSEDLSNDYEAFKPEINFTKEYYVSKRAGHIAVSYNNGVLVWAGYTEVPPHMVENEYWPPNEVWHYSYLTDSWRKLTTSGDVPNRCSGAGGCVLDDHLYVVAGFHLVFSNRRRDSPNRSDDEDSDDENQPRIEISNRIWSLNLHTLVWKKLSPKGIPPLYCDKTTIWSHSDKVYLFGGFGPPPAQSIHSTVLNKFQYVVDVEGLEGYMYVRGWSNQLVYYDRSSDKWVWPDCTGTTPTPRAAHSSAVIRDKVYVFGGRYVSQRLNDLHCLDLNTMTWNSLLMPSNSLPQGRSWQSLTPLETGHTEGGLLLYGGFNNDHQALSDCWRLDLSSEMLCWEQQKHFELGPRLWHTAASPNPSMVMIVGGITNNILGEYIHKKHAEKVLYLRVSVPSLLGLTLEYIAANTKLFQNQMEELPQSLRKILELRTSGA